MKQKGLSFRNEIEFGPGGKQIQLQDPDGNPIELSAGLKNVVCPCFYSRKRRWALKFSVGFFTKPLLANWCRQPIE